MSDHGVQQVEVKPLPPDQFRDVLDDDGWKALQETIGQADDTLAGRVVWMISSTAKGGGVAEMLHSLIAYSDGAGIDARWLVIPGDEEFFRITKRIHNHLHGSDGDGRPLGDEEHKAYERTLAPSAEAIDDIIGDNDVVVVHDPQPAGLIGRLRERGVRVVWRCHIGIDHPNDAVREAWDFLRPYVKDADRFVFSRDAHVWEGMDHDRVTVIPPSIDAFAVKNADLPEDAVDAILQASEVLDGGREGGRPVYAERDGEEGTVHRPVDMRGVDRLSADLPIVCQVSRWDRLKDHLGVMRGFAEHVLPHHDAQLVLAGPEAASVSDDPEGSEVLSELEGAYADLPESAQQRIAIACLPMEDAAENAAIVNALQRRSDIVVQKSLAEGFGLTVAEAMWKGRPVIGSRVGGIQDQIVDGESGRLVGAEDLEEYGKAVAELIDDDALRERMGEAARARVRESFLGPRHLTQWYQVFAGVLSGDDG